ncbi:hypothetical protein DMENIID0001_020550 [Sergentomyia squamirostris]
MKKKNTILYSKDGWISMDVQPKPGQKRPSPAPPIPSSPHLHQSSSAVTATASQQLSNHVSNHLPPGAVGGVGAAVGTSATSGRGPFASALRNLAKQADIKDDDATAVGSGGGGGVSVASGGASGGGGGGNLSSGDVVRGVNSGATSLMTTVQRTGTHDSRAPTTGDGRGSNSVVAAQAHGSDGRQLAIDERKKRTASPPPEKMARLSGPPSLQPDLALARSGFQPYRPDERLTHPAGAFPLEAYTSFGAIPGLPPGSLFNPAALQYPEQLYLDQRIQSMFRSVGHHPHAHPHPLYSPLASPYAPHLYGMLPAGAALGLGVPGFHERLKQEEEHRARLARQEEERERELQREKERELREQREREREQREKEQREREQREKEQREKEQREKEAREREMREKEREARERERLAAAAASHHYPPQMYTHPSMRNMPHNLLGQLMPPAPPSGLASLAMSLRPPMSQLSPYHTSSQRQSPHAAMSLSMGMGLPPLPPHSVHSSLNLSHHLPLGHPSAVPVTHPSMGHPGAAGGVPTSLALGHPGLLAHTGGSLNLSSTGSPTALNLGANPQVSSHSVNLTVDRDSRERSSSIPVSLYGGYGMAVSSASSERGGSGRSASVSIPAVSSASSHYHPPARPSSQPQSVMTSLSSNLTSIPKSPQMPQPPPTVSTAGNGSSTVVNLITKESMTELTPPPDNSVRRGEPSAPAVEVVNGANSSLDEISAKEENGGAEREPVKSPTSNGGSDKTQADQASAAETMTASNNGEAQMSPSITNNDVTRKLPTPPGADNNGSSNSLEDNKSNQQTGKDDTTSATSPSPPMAPATKDQSVVVPPAALKIHAKNPKVPSDSDSSVAATIVTKHQHKRFYVNPDHQQLVAKQQQQVVDGNAGGGSILSTGQQIPYTRPSHLPPYDTATSISAAASSASTTNTRQ